MRIKVELQGSFEQCRLLRYDGHRLSDPLKPQISNVEAINLNAPAAKLHNPRQSKRERALAGARPSDHANLLSTLNRKTQAPEHHFHLGPVPQLHLFESDVSFPRPTAGCLQSAVSALLWDFHDPQALLDVDEDLLEVADNVDDELDEGSHVDHL